MLTLFLFFYTILNSGGIMPLLLQCVIFKSHSGIASKRDGMYYVIIVCFTYASSRPL